MTEHKWTPVSHVRPCPARYSPTRSCTCDGSRGYGYGERVGDAMGVRGLCVLFERLGGMVSVPEQPTTSMIIDGFKASFSNDPTDNHINRIYAAMLAASRREGGAE